MTKRNIVAERLASYLAGKGTLPEQSFSSSDLTVALGRLLADRAIDDDDIAARVRAILRGRKARFEQPRVVAKALKLRRDGEPLFMSLQHVRQSRLRRTVRRRRRVQATC